MPALAPRALDGWTPGTSPQALRPFSFLLIYGGDEGGISALAADITAGPVPALRLGADTISAPELRAHLSTGGLFGPAAPVRIQGASDKHVAVLRKALDGVEGGPTVVVEAGVLKKDSKLKALFDQLGATVAIHPLDAKAAATWLGRATAAAGLPLAKNALAGAQERLPSDRMRLLRLGEVLVLHALGREAGSVEAIDIAAFVGQDGDVDLTQALMAALVGQADEALQALDVQMAAGENPIALARAWGWKLQRFDDMARSGQRPSAAVASARPPVFFAERAKTEQALARLGAPGIGAALEGLDEAERAVVHRGQPARTVFERWLLRVAFWKPGKDA